MAKVAIGFTESNRSAGYVSYIDGWKQEAEQNVWVLDVPEELMMDDIELVADAFFEASNEPLGFYDESGAWIEGNVPFRSTDHLIGWFQHYLYGPAAGAWRSLSVGDTVSFVYYDAEANIIPQAVVSCEAFGWKRHL